MRFFEELSLWMNVAMFLAAAIIVWLSGTKISHYADAISKKTGLGQAVLGVLLLGGVTSMPELAVTVSATVTGNSVLAVNNLLGGIAMQVAILAIADAAIGRRALSSSVPDPTVLLQGSLCIVLLSIAATATLIDDVAIFGVGISLWLLIGGFIYAITALSQAGDTRPWMVPEQDQRATDGEKDKNDGEKDKQKGNRLADLSLPAIILRTVLAAGVITVAGFVLAQTGDAIAQKTGLGSSFVGAVLVAFATSLPEVSTVLSAARLGLYTMAISDIFGTNLFDAALLFVVDATADGPPVLNGAGSFATAAAILGILVTAIFLSGLAERRDRTIVRMGYDSAAVLTVYLVGIWILYGLR